MRKQILSIVFLLLTTSFAFASPVDPATARKAAENFIAMLAPKDDNYCLTDVSNSFPFEGLYLFDINNGKGFIVVAADDNTEPILAYSFSNPFPVTDMPANVKAWFRGYEMEVRHNSIAATSSFATTQWNDVLAGRPASASKEVIQPILNTKWNQSPYYNLLCPYDSSEGSRPPCGCTATATAQIMKSFNHPAQGFGSEQYTHQLYGPLSADYGSTNYVWDSMPEELTSSSSDAQVDAVARLIYHIGVSVNMDYRIGGSAGKTASYGYGGEPSSENALKYNFRYSPYIWTAFRIDYSLDDWRELMVNELRNGRPILYAGYDEVQSGHAFVLDGYNAGSKRFHINWGWGGNYDGNYKINDLSPTGPGMFGSYNFNLFATATIGIEPFAQFGEATTTVSTSAEGEGNVTGAGTYNFGDTITLTATANNRYTRFVQWSDGCRYNPRQTVATGGQLLFTAQFAPLQSDTIRFHTCDNAMNRASNLPDGLGCDSIWGIRIPAESIKSGARLDAVRFMGRRAGTHTLTILSGTDSPATELYSATFYDSLDYPYTYHQHNLSSPIIPAEGQSLWIVLKCTDVDTPGVFSIYGGNPYGMLSGENLEEKDSDWKFSWMIEALFNGNVGIDDSNPSTVSFSIFPNPAADRITLQGLPNEAVVEIIDASGRTAFATKSTSDVQSIDTSKMPSGIYIVRVTTSYGSATRRMLVK